MTIGEVLERVQAERPGESGEAELIRWLSQLDGRWRREMLETHAPGVSGAFAGYTPSTAQTTALLIAPPFDEVYMHYLYAQIDQRLGEIDRYLNDAQLFNALWEEAEKSYHSSHLPLEKHRLRGYRPGSVRRGSDPLGR